MKMSNMDNTVNSGQLTFKIFTADASALNVYVSSKTQMIFSDACSGYYLPQRF